jgi:hypothetical protein
VSTFRARWLREPQEDAEAAWVRYRKAGAENKPRPWRVKGGKFASAAAAAAFSLPGGAEAVPAAAPSSSSGSLSKDRSASLLSAKDVHGGAGEEDSALADGAHYQEGVPVPGSLSLPQEIACRIAGRREEDAPPAGAKEEESPAAARYALSFLSPLWL